MPTRAQRRAEVLRQVEAVETLMDKVLGQLDTKCLCRAAGANRAWEQAASADSLWRAICSREGQSLLLTANRAGLNHGNATYDSALQQRSAWADCCRL